MLRDFPGLIYIRGYRSYTSQPATPGAWWWLMAPGIALMCTALAMMIWPALLAYVVGSLLLCAGIFLAGTAWQMRHSGRHGQRYGSRFEG